MVQGGTITRGVRMSGGAKERKIYVSASASGTTVLVLYLARVGFVCACVGASASRILSRGRLVCATHDSCQLQKVKGFPKKLVGGALKDGRVKKPGVNCKPLGSVAKILPLVHSHPIV